MKKIILVGAIALLAACGSSDNGASVSTDGDQAAATAAPDAGDQRRGLDDDTITVDNFGDMPPKCIELLSAFLKKIEPTVSDHRLGQGDARRFRRIRRSVQDRVRCVRCRDCGGGLQQVQPQRVRREAVRADERVGRSRGARHARFHQVPRRTVDGCDRERRRSTNGLRRHHRSDRAVPGQRRDDEGSDDGRSHQARAADAGDRHELHRGRGRRVLRA